MDRRGFLRLCGLIPFAGSLSILGQSGKPEAVSISKLSLSKRIEKALSDAENPAYIWVSPDCMLTLERECIERFGIKPTSLYCAGVPIKVCKHLAGEVHECLKKMDFYILEKWEYEKLCPIWAEYCYYKDSCSCIMRKF